MVLKIQSRLKTFFEEFTDCDLYINLSKADKRKYNKSYFINYFEINVSLKNTFFKRNHTERNVVRGWINNLKV